MDFPGAFNNRVRTAPATYFINWGGLLTEGSGYLAAGGHTSDQMAAGPELHCLRSVQYSSITGVPDQ